MVSRLAIVIWCAMSGIAAVLLAWPAAPAFQLIQRYEGRLINYPKLSSLFLPYELLSLGIFGLLIASGIAFASKWRTDPRLALIAGLRGALAGVVLAPLALAILDWIVVRLAYSYDSHGLLTPAQYAWVDDTVGLTLYYTLVPTALGVSIAIGAGLRRYNLERGIIGIALGSALGFVCVHVALVLAIVFVVLQALTNSDPNIDGMLQSLMAVHLAAMGVGLGISFAIVDSLYKPFWLKGKNSVLEGRTWAIPRPVAVLGSLEGVSVYLPPDGLVALHHAQIQAQGERHYVVGVQGPVQVNGAEVDAQWLTDGDVLQIGGYRIEYRNREAPKKPVSTPLPIRSSTKPRPRLIDSMGFEHSLTPGDTVVGRDGAGVALPWEASVSRRHAVIHWNGASPTLRDLGSTNGTYVNGSRLAGEAPLKDGDEVRLGNCRLVYRESDEARASSIT